LLAQAEEEELELAEGTRSAAFLVPYVTADGIDGKTMRDSRRDNADENDRCAKAPQIDQQFFH
jgi:hypothetical protein